MLKPQVKKACYYNPFENSSTAWRNFERHFLGGPNGHMFVFGIDTLKGLDVDQDIIDERDIYSQTSLDRSPQPSIYTRSPKL